MNWKVVFIYLFFLCLSSPLPPQNETIMGGGSKKKQAFFSVVQHWKISEEFFFLAIPDKKYKQQSQQDVFGSVVFGLEAPPPL